MQKTANLWNFVFTKYMAYTVYIARVLERGGALGFPPPQFHKKILYESLLNEEIKILLLYMCTLYIYAETNMVQSSSPHNKKILYESLNSLRGNKQKHVYMYMYMYM